MWNGNESHSLKKFIIDLEICSFLQPTFTCLVSDFYLLLNTLFEKTYRGLSEKYNDIVFLLQLQKLRSHVSDFRLAAKQFLYNFEIDLSAASYVEQSPACRQTFQFPS